MELAVEENENRPAQRHRYVGSPYAPYYRESYLIHSDDISRNHSDALVDSSLMSSDNPNLMCVVNRKQFPVEEILPTCNLGLLDIVMEAGGISQNSGKSSCRLWLQIILKLQDEV